MTGEFEAFAETNYGNQGNDGRKIMTALRTNIQAMIDILFAIDMMNFEDAKSVPSGADDNGAKLALRVDCEHVLYKLLSLTLQVMKMRR